MRLFICSFATDKYGALQKTEGHFVNKVPESEVKFCILAETSKVFKYSWRKKRNNFELDLQIFSAQILIPTIQNSVCSAVCSLFLFLRIPPSFP